MARKTKGRLYTRGKSGHYYLQYYVGGKQIRVALKDADGQSITRKADAEAAAGKILLPLTARSEADRLRLVVNEMTAAERKAETAEQDLKNRTASLENGWEVYMTCPSRLRSCKRPRTADTPVLLGPGLGCSLPRDSIHTPGLPTRRLPQAAAAPGCRAWE